MIRALNTNRADIAAALARHRTVAEAMDYLAREGYLEARPDLTDSFGEPVYRPTEKFTPWLEGGTIL